MVSKASFSCLLFKSKSNPEEPNEFFVPKRKEIGRLARPVVANHPTQVNNYWNCRIQRINKPDFFTLLLVLPVVLYVDTVGKKELLWQKQRQIGSCQGCEADNTLQGHINLSHFITHKVYTDNDLSCRGFDMMTFTPCHFLFNLLCKWDQKTWKLIGNIMLRDFRNEIKETEKAKWRPASWIWRKTLENSLISWLLQRPCADICAFIN